MSTLHHITNDMSQKQDNCNVCPCGHPVFSRGKCQDCLRIGLRTSLTARPIRRIKPVGAKTPRKPRKDFIANLQRLEQGGAINRHTVTNYVEQGYVTVRYIKEISLTAKGKKLIETA